MGTDKVLFAFSSLIFFYNLVLKNLQCIDRAHFSHALPTIFMRRVELILLRDNRAINKI